MSKTELAKNSRDAKHARKAQRYGKGTTEWVGRGDRGCWYAKVSVPGQDKRERFKLSDEHGRPLNDKQGDRPLARQLTAEISKRVRSQAYEQQRREQATRLTVQQFGERWTSGELLETYGEVNGLRELKSATVLGYMLSAHVYPLIGRLKVDSVTEADIERVMREAPRRAQRKRGKPWRQTHKGKLYAAMHRLFELTIMPGRLRADNPVSRYLKPAKGAPKLFGFLYPNELVQLLACRDVPIGRRVLYALAVYTGLRKSSLYALRWSGVDFHHGTLTSLQSKTGLPQLFELPSTLVALLAQWRRYQGEPSKDTPLVASEHIGRVKTRSGGRGNSTTKWRRAKGREAEALRADLRAAGVDRATLFESNAANVEPIRFHDLRATFVTWAMRQGRGDGWISDRTGHLTPEQRARYARQARTLADLRYDPFPDISAALPELVELTHNVRLLPQRGA